MLFVKPYQINQPFKLPKVVWWPAEHLDAQVWPLLRRWPRQGESERDDLPPAHHHAESETGYNLRWWDPHKMHIKNQKKTINGSFQAQGIHSGAHFGGWPFWSSETPAMSRWPHPQAGMETMEWPQQCTPECSLLSSHCTSNIFGNDLYTSHQEVLQVGPLPRRPRSLVQRLTTWESVHTWGDPPIFPIASDEFPKLKSKHNLSFYCCSHFESVWGMNWSPFHSAYFRHGFCLVSSGCRSLANAADVAGVCLVWHKQLQGQLQHCRPVSWHDVSKAALTGR